MLIRCWGPPRGAAVGRGVGGRSMAGCAPGGSHMNQHPALTPGRSAVVTGAASGIGLAAARRFAKMGLRVCLADLDWDALRRAAADVARIATGGTAAVRAVPTDVARLDDVQQLHEVVLR